MGTLWATKGGSKLEEGLGVWTAAAREEGDMVGVRLGYVGMRWERWGLGIVDLGFWPSRRKPRLRRSPEVLMLRLWVRLCRCCSIFIELGGYMGLWEV